VSLYFSLDGVLQCAMRPCTLGWMVCYNTVCVPVGLVGWSVKMCNDSCMSEWMVFSNVDCDQACQAGWCDTMWTVFLYVRLDVVLQYGPRPFMSCWLVFHNTDCVPVCQARWCIKVWTASLYVSCMVCYNVECFPACQTGCCVTMWTASVYIMLDGVLQFGLPNFI
jgi:hypothetical protein